ncbi:MAG: GIY-YIG nuclease family protein [Rickettsiales bacterium]|nr:GIY-YIG nuclease family protein [Rickettsiales bacterium]
MHYVYILQSVKFSDRYYVGQTDDLKKRLSRHNAGYAKATKPFVPWKIVSYHAFADVSTAMNFEKYLKSGSGVAFAKKRLR